MTEELAKKLKSLGYPDFEMMPGEDAIEMLYIQGKLICGVNHALSLSDEDLKALIDETVGE